VPPATQRLIARIRVKPSTHKTDPEPRLTAERRGNNIHGSISYCKWLKPRPESGLDWLIYSKFARDRVDVPPATERLLTANNRLGSLVATGYEPWDLDASNQSRIQNSHTRVRTAVNRDSLLEKCVTDSPAHSACAPPRQQVTSPCNNRLRALGPRRPESESNPARTNPTQNRESLL